MDKQQVAAEGLARARSIVCRCAPLATLDGEFGARHDFVDLDTMIGKDFETGLANLKTLAEK